MAEETEGIEYLTVEQIAKKTNGLKRRMVPIGGTRVTAFVDVQQNMLFFVVAAWQDDFTLNLLPTIFLPSQAMRMAERLTVERCARV